MSGGGSTTNTATKTSTGPFSWNGATSPSSVDPKTFGTDILGDAEAAYKQGPQATIPSYNPYTPQTTGLINSGLSQVASENSPALSAYASGKYLDGSDDPYFQSNLDQTNSDVLKTLGSQFTSSGRFGGGSYIDTATSSLANTDNQAKEANLTDEWNKMLAAQGQQATNTSTGLGYSGLLDEKQAEKTASDQQQQQEMSPYGQIQKYLSLLNTGNATTNTNQPTSIWDILGAAGTAGGDLLSLFGL